MFQVSDEVKGNTSLGTNRYFREVSYGKQRAYKRS